MFRLFISIISLIAIASTLGCNKLSSGGSAAEAVSTDPTGQASGLTTNQIADGTPPALPSNQAAYNVLKQNCAHCHGALSAGVGGISDILDAGALVKNGWVVQGDPQNSPLYKDLVSHRMPFNGMLDAQSIQTVYNWIADGAVNLVPSSQPGVLAGAIRNSAALDLISADLTALKKNQQYYRYFTMSNLANSNLTSSQIGLVPQALTKLCNSLSWNKTLATPVAVDAAQTIWRIDIRNYNWTAAQWETLVAAYPFAKQQARNSNWKQLQSTSKSQVPVVRADWFVNAATQPGAYANMLGLTTLSALETQLGVDSAGDIQQSKVVRGGFEHSGVSLHNRVIERHTSTFGAYWKSYDFLTDDGTQNIFSFPLGPETATPATNALFTPTAGEMIFTLPNGTHGYFIATNSGAYLPLGLTSVVLDPTRTDQTVTNGISCFSCHATSALNDNTDQIFDYFNNPANKQPTATVAAVQAIYPGAAKVLASLASDRAGYFATEAKMGISRTQIDPVSTVSMLYDNQMDITAVAADMDVTPAQIQQAIQSNPLLAAYISQLSAKGGAISRQNFLQYYAQILAALPQ